MYGPVQTHSILKLLFFLFNKANSIMVPKIEAISMILDFSFLRLNLRNETSQISTS